MSKHPTEEEIQRTNKHRESSSISLIWEMKMKITTTCHYTPLRMANIEK